jgi:hypothetical protein
MIIRFNIDLPFVLKKECVEEMKKYIREEVNRAIQMYGVFEVIAKVRPKGVKEKAEEEEDFFEGKRFWFEEVMESE